MSILTIKEMFEANVHFGHKISRWNPKMLQYIYITKNGMHIIDLRKTIVLMNKALSFIYDIRSKGGNILFVGTKKQARDVIVKFHNKTDSFAIYNRWLGGMLTNFETIKKSIYRMKKLDALVKNKVIGQLSKKEASFLNRDLLKLKKNLLGVRNMQNLPEAIFVVDPFYERIAVKEAETLKIPIIAMVDTNCNPDLITYPIPANDDSVKSITFFIDKIEKAYLEGQEYFINTQKKDVDNG
jgi:small subunit ribosomal protein S2